MSLTTLTESAVCFYKVNEKKHIKEAPVFVFIWLQLHIYTIILGLIDVITAVELTRYRA